MPASHSCIHALPHVLVHFVWALVTAYTLFTSYDVLVLSLHATHGFLTSQPDQVCCCFQQACASAAVQLSASLKISTFACNKEVATNGIQTIHSCCCQAIIPFLILCCLCLLTSTFALYPPLHAATSTSYPTLSINQRTPHAGTPQHLPHQTPPALSTTPARSLSITKPCNCTVTNVSEPAQPCRQTPTCVTGTAISPITDPVHHALRRPAQNQ